MLDRRPLLKSDRAKHWPARAAACLIAAMIGLTFGNGLAFATEKPKVAPVPAKAPPAPAPVPDWPLGSERARVTLVEYGSLTCSHCADFNNNILPSLKASHITPGRVRYVFRAFPTPPMGLSYPLHSLARCAGPQAYHKVLDAFFQQQSVIFEAAQQGKGAKDAVYRIFTQSSGMSAAQADVCLRTQSHAEAVNQQSVTGEELGVSGTPTFFIQTARGTTLLPPPYDAQSIGRALDAALAALPPAPRATPTRTKAKPKPKAKKP